MEGRELKLLRALAGMTQAQFARELGVARRTVTRWETGEGVIPDSVLGTIKYIVENNMTRKLATEFANLIEQSTARKIRIR